MGIWDFECQAHFTMEIMNQFGGANNTILLSPAPLYMALAIVFLGSGGKTILEFTQLTFCVGDDENYANFPHNLPPFISRQSNTSGYSEFGRNYVKNGLHVRHDYIKVLNESNFDVKHVDFSNPQTLRMINGDIANATNGKIKNLVTELAPNSTSLPVAAQLFQDEWGVQFNGPQNQTFYMKSGGTKMVPMIQQISGEFGFYEDRYFQVIRVPFSERKENKDCSDHHSNKTPKCGKKLRFPRNYFLIFLPREHIELEEAMENFDGFTILNALKANENQTQIDLTFPTFSFSHLTPLKKVLHNLGLKKAFNPYKANFMGMSWEALYIDDIFHENKIEVTSKGVEAATGSFTKMLHYPNEEQPAKPIPQKKPKRDYTKIERNHVNVKRDHYKIIVNQPFMYAVFEYKEDQTLTYAGIFN